MLFDRNRLRARKIKLKSKSSWSRYDIHMPVPSNRPLIDMRCGRHQNIGQGVRSRDRSIDQARAPEYLDAVGDSITIDEAAFLV